MNHLARRVLPVLAALLCLGGVALAAAAKLPAAWRAQLHANERAARQDARALLESLHLPAGVRRIAGEPRFARPLGGGGALDYAYNAGEQSWWESAAGPQSIIAYVEAHRPPGASILSTGSGGDSQTATTSLEVMFSWPPIGAQVYNRTLTLSVITPAHGDSAIVARSEAAWIVPRAASERVPAAVHDIELSLRIGGGPFGERHMRTRTYLVWRRTRVATIVRELDSLLTVQPGVAYSCPAEVGGVQRPELTLQFRAGPAGPALARATVYVFPGRTGASGWNACDPIAFWIGSRAQTPLTSRTFVRSIGRLMGADIS